MLLLDQVSDHQENAIFRYANCTPVTSVLHTSNESRSTALENYSLEFEIDKNLHISGVEVTFSFPLRIYVNLDCDELFLDELPEMANNYQWYYFISTLACVI